MKNNKETEKNSEEKIIKKSKKITISTTNNTGYLDDEVEYERPDIIRSDNSNIDGETTVGYYD